MVKKPYSWKDGNAILGEHSKKKHQVLRQYLCQYLHVRCKIPQQERFRLAIIDAFAGAGVYKDGNFGSPLIFMDLLLETTKEINVWRAANGMAQINFECLLIFNDADRDAVELLKTNLMDLQLKCDSQKNLTIDPIFLNYDFEAAYPEIKKILSTRNFKRNLFFNLDQCGHILVPQRIISDILNTYPSSEILLNLAIQALLTYLSRNDYKKTKQTLEQHGVGHTQIEDISPYLSDRNWRAAIEKLVFQSYRQCAQYVSPFAIKNPEGWSYWLLHFANTPKARQVYNDLLHENPSVQGHCGRSGLNMLTYNPIQEGQYYLFGADDRKRALEALQDDIPKVVSEFGDAIQVGNFIENVSNTTPCHSLDLNQAMISNPDLTVRTENGGERRSAKGVKPTDTLVLKPQKSFILTAPLKKS